MNIVKWTLLVSVFYLNETKRRNTPSVQLSVIWISASRRCTAPHGAIHLKHNLEHHRVTRMRNFWCKVALVGFEWNYFYLYNEKSEALTISIRQNSTPTGRTSETFVKPLSCSHKGNKDHKWVCRGLYLLLTMLTTIDHTKQSNIKVKVVTPVEHPLVK